MVFESSWCGVFEWFLRFSRSLSLTGGVSLASRPQFRFQRGSAGVEVKAPLVVPVCASSVAVAFVPSARYSVPGSILPPLGSKANHALRVVCCFAHAAARINAHSPRVKLKPKLFLPCQRGRCAATCAAHEHTKLAAIPNGRKGTRRDRHERPHAHHPVRIRSARRDWRGGQAGEEMPHLLARCAARVAAGMAQGRARAGMSADAKPAACIVRSGFSEYSITALVKRLQIAASCRKRLQFPANDYLRMTCRRF